MKHKKRKNLTMIVVSAAILVTVNLGVWLAAKQGAIAPIGNDLLWTAFVALNVISLVWAISLLGLHPLVVTLSYVAGGFLAFKGVEGMSGISVAEVTTAGATYGAFGALAVGNCTTKVRFAFFNKGQVSFIFIIAALLVFDAVLNSEISSADGSVILNAVVFPFVLAGVIIGLVWSVLNRYGIGQKVDLAHGAIAVEHPNTVEEVEEAEEANTLKIQMPAHIEEEEDVDAAAAVMEEVELPETLEAPVEDPIKPIVAREEKKEKEEEFFPLEIDKGDDFALPEEETYGAVEMAAELNGLDEDPYSLTAFDTSLYASGIDEDGHGGVMVEEPVVSLALDLDEKAEVESEAVPVVEATKEAEPEPIAQVEPEQKKSTRSDDWLSGHLDLLNKLK
jgi:hypothetical protein